MDECYHVPFTRNGGTTYAALHTVTVTFIPQQWQHLLAATLHTVTDTYATFTHNDSNIYQHQYYTQ